MTWLGNATVDGTKSVKDNKSRLNGSLGYTETTEQVDHFWDNANSNLDGHHQFSQMPKTESGGNPADPTIATDMDGVYYVREKTTTEVPDGDTIVPEPFYKVNDGTNDQIMQLGFRAMGHFEVSSGVLSSKYLHNCSISRTSEGLYTVTFTVAMPSDNYVVLAGSMRNATSNPESGGVLKMQSAAAKSTVMTSAMFKLAHTRNTSNDLSDPIAGWFAVMGG